jgi:hypothetical protein
MIAPMHALLRVGLAMVPLVMWLLASAQSTFACEGGDAPLSTGIRGATSVFYARIVGLQESSDGFYDLRLDVGRVVKGTGTSHVGHLITPRACDVLEVGDAGVVVLGSINPYGVGPNDIYNFFYVLGPRHTSAADANTILSRLPETDTGSFVVGDIGSKSTQVEVLIAAAVAGFVFVSGYLRQRRPRVINER